MDDLTNSQRHLENQRGKPKRSKTTERLMLMQPQSITMDLIHPHYRTALNLAAKPTRWCVDCHAHAVLGDLCSKCGVV